VMSFRIEVENFHLNARYSFWSDAVKFNLLIARPLKIGKR
jgi:hypothetical protein